MELLSNYYKKNLCDNADVNKTITQRVSLLWRLIHGSKEGLAHLLSSVVAESTPARRYLLRNSALPFTCLPPTYSPLAKLRGKCPNCQQGGNPIHLCLVCSFRGCRFCTKTSLFTHTVEEHASNCIFLNLETATLLYISEQRAWMENKLYINEIGEGFNVFQDWEQYCLDEKEYQEARMLVVRHDVGVFVEEKERRHNRYIHAMEL